MERTSSMGWEPAFEFRCDIQWKDMRPMDSTRGTRRCDRCERTVHLCRTLAQFQEHARRGNCVAVYEYGPVARTTANANETHGAPEDSSSADRPFDPFAPDPVTPGLVTPSYPLPPSRPSGPGPVPRPTAGMPQRPGTEK